eukprot:5704101-Prymnesium_polylepis.1
MKSTRSCQTARASKHRGLNTAGPQRRPMGAMAAMMNEIGEIDSAGKATGAITRKSASSRPG